MKLEAYKRGQGTYARAVTAAGLGLIGLFAAQWTYGLLIELPEVAPGSIPLKWGLVISVLLFSLVGVIAAFLTLGLVTEVRWLQWLDHMATGSVDFLIDTEAELRKVSWPSKQEVLGSTGVVIALVVILGVYVFAVDWIVQTIMRTIRVL
ncbi:MAG: preprotein translocase subunit SecE [Planctomycetes bacterium]|nr:preprotein translocase subunit SecE [Planctomycetota bacterium]